MTDSVVDITQYKYDQAEKELRSKMVEYTERPEFQSQMAEAFYIWKNDPDFISEDIDGDKVDDITFEKFFDWFLYDFKLLDSEETFVERYYNQAQDDLSKIEIKIIKDWLHSYYSYFEVEEIPSPERCVIRDIFTRKTFEVLESATAKNIKRSDIIGARPLKIGNHLYFSGIISVYPATFKSIIKDFLDNEFKEYKVLSGKQKTKIDYLKDWGFQVGHYIEDLSQNPHFITPEGNEFILATATYSISDLKKAMENIGKIKSIKELSGESEELRVFTWEKHGKNSVNATLEIENNNLRIDCYSVEMLNIAKSRIESELKGLVEHKDDKVKDIGKFIEKTTSDKKSTKKLPIGVKNKKELDTALDDHYETWVDTPLGILDGLTPKEALGSDTGKEKLKAVIEELRTIYEQARRRGEPYYDIEKLRKKLNLI